VLGRIKAAAASRSPSASLDARETLACVEVGVALGYVPGVREDVRARMQQILGTLTKLAR
jgi:hypothetical protein